MSAPTVVVHSITKAYPGHPPIRVLRDVSLTAHRGERVAIVGSSGAGKSTLLNILGLLDTPTSGTYELLGEDTGQLSESTRAKRRAADLGFVFQEHHVLGARTVAENLEIKLGISRVARHVREELVGTALDQVGLDHRRHAEGRLLSGGEKQRLAVARAIVTRPQILLADEPTGNLDGHNAANVLALFDAQARGGVTVLVITHDPAISAWADRTVRLEDGRLRAQVAS